MKSKSNIRLSRKFAIEIVREPHSPPKLSLGSVIRDILPTRNLPSTIAKWRRQNAKFILPGFFRYLRSRVSGGTSFTGALYFDLVGQDGQESNFGLVSLDLVTDVGLGFVVDSFIGEEIVSNLRYHGLGTNNTAAAAGDLTLGTELSSSYTTPNVRVTGTGVQGVAENIFVTVGFTTFSVEVNCVEWGLFAQSATDTGDVPLVGGPVFDRAVFATQNIPLGFGGRTTYVLTVTRA